MAFLKYLINHNGSISNNITDASSIVLTNGSSTSTIDSATTRTLNCKGKYTPNNITIGSKTLNCANKIMSDNIVIETKDAITKIPYSGSTGDYLGGTVASNNNIVISPLLLGGCILYSTDGVNWSRSNPIASNMLMATAYGNGKFVTLEYNGNKAFYSTDGINWTETTLPSSQNWWSVIYGNDKFVAVPGRGSGAAYSLDGIHWVEFTLPFSLSSNGYGEICYVNNEFIICDLALTVYRSTDGINYNSYDLPIRCSSIAYGGGKYVAAGAKNGACYSVDGINWVTSTLPVETTGQIIDWGQVTYGDGLFVVGSIGGGAYINCSTDGINWVFIPNVAEMVDGIGYGLNKFIIMGYSASEICVL